MHLSFATAEMSKECPECNFTNQSIVSWRKKLEHFDMCEHFGRRPCSIAKGVFATKAIKEVNLLPDVAKIHAYFNGEKIDFEIIIQDNGLIETSIDKRKITSQIVTIAALMEILIIINSAPEQSAEEEQSIQASVEEKNDDDKLDESEIVSNTNVLQNGAVKKNVLVKFYMSGNDVVMRAYLDNNDKKPIFMQSSSSVTVISGNAKKMALLRLLYYAKKAKFEFCSSNRDYRLKNLRDATDLMRHKIDIWDKFFFVTLSPEMLLLKHGVIFPEICAKVEEVDDYNIKISWEIKTKYGHVPESYMHDLLRANGRAIFVENIGAVALTVDQISVVRHVFCNSADGLLRKYMLYVLLNQHCVRVDASGCRISNFEVGTSTFPLPSFLKKYQQDGVYSMQAILDAGCHCLLADEMGLGKTLQVLSLICSRPHTTKTLVVCPASVVFVWQREIAKFFPEKTSHIVDRSYEFIDLPDFLLCSYAQVHKLNAKLRGITFDYIVMDEAQYGKNPRSKTMMSCCNIDSKHRIAITGTPIENNLTDIWSIFKFLMPGFFCGYKQFQENIQYQDFRDSFKQQIATFTIRRTKQSVALELPKRNELDLLCQMTDGQRHAYDAIRKNLRTKLNSAVVPNARNRMNILTAIMRLRQAACAQFILPEDLRHDNSRASYKVDAVMLKLANIAAGGKKAIIFSQFLDLLRDVSGRIQEALPEVSVHILTGSTNNRQEVVEKFQLHKGSAVMLISLKAGGVGITLHSAEYVFLMEPWWNPAVEEQAIARIHRIGQKNVTTIYRMITEHSIEERMRHIQVTKTALFNEFIKTGVDNIALTNFYLKNLEHLLE